MFSMTVLSLVRDATSGTTLAGAGVAIVSAGVALSISWSEATKIHHNYCKHIDIRKHGTRIVIYSESVIICPVEEFVCPVVTGLCKIQNMFFSFSN